LEHAVCREEALDVSLLLLDGELPDEIRTQAAEDLDECLAVPRALDSLEAVLYAAPLPEMADLPGALRCAQNHEQSVLPFLLCLKAQQPAIRAVRQAWEALPEQFFGDADERRDAMTMCLRAGLFRDAARALAEGGSLGSLVMQVLNTRPELDRFRKALAHWGEILSVQTSDHQDEIANFVRDYNVMIMHDNAPTLITSSGTPSHHVPERTLTWLHISDVHFQAPDSGTRRSHWAQDEVKQTFIRDLPKLLGEQGLEPDIVFLTGDVAASGDRKEYDIVIRFLDELQQCLPKPHAPVMLVPGNHDVYRPVVDQYRREETHALEFLRSNQATIDYLHSPEHEDHRTRVFRRLESFQAFAKRCERFGQPPLNGYGSFSTIQTVNGVKIGIAGLNSAWRGSSDADRGRLVLGVPQINDAVKQLEEAHLRLALVHHPPETDWYVLHDVVYQRKTFSSFDFLLHGHEHDPHQLSFFAGREYCQISAGALYSTDVYQKSFNVVQLDLETGSARVFFWKLGTGMLKWVKDVELYRNGYQFFQMPEKFAARLTEVISSGATASDV
jgi:calcineurin-like phosphoesterase family protein